MNSKGETEKTLYLKYRPKKFSDVVGQDHIVSVLKSSVADGAHAHAYLFAGPRGTGKTSIARILASELGTSVNDLYEIDGASNRGIDGIRELREAVRVHPLDSQFKIYIIDEVHMLTRESFNALLKTLEEPPEHAIFILATTELHKVPETIISRCQTFEFRKPTEVVLEGHIESLAKKEGVALEKGGGHLIAFLAEGSFRDALGILQKVVAAGGKKIKIEDIEAVTGAPRSRLVDELLGALLDKDESEGLNTISRAKKQNTDFEILLRMLMVEVRNTMLIMFAPALKDAIADEVGKDAYARLEKASKHANARTLPRILKRLLEAHAAQRNTFVPEIPLELALIDLADSGGTETKTK